MAKSRETITSDDVGTVNASELVGNQWDGEIPQGYEEEQVGFPPYWSPEEGGQRFSGIPIARDDKDPEFVRYTLIADRVIHCKKGPAEDAEQVIVRPGERFSVSEYASLPLAELFGLPMMAVATHKSKTSTPGQSVWNWKLFLTPESKKQLHARRAEAAAMFENMTKKPAELKSA